MAFLQGQARFSGDVRPWTHHAVFFKENWADEWTWVPYVRAIDATQTVGPSVDQCTFEFDFGQMKRELWATFEIWDPLMVLGTYVCVYCYDPFAEWSAFVGVVDFESAKLDGTLAYPQGLQRFNAYGLEHLLDRRQIDESITEVGTIQRNIIFNQRAGRGLKAQGNKRTSYHQFGADNDEWTNLKICEYVVHNFSDSAIDWDFYGPGLDVLDEIVEEHDLWGMTPLQVLNKLIDRRRGLVWCVTPELTPGGAVGIYVTTSLAFPIVYEGAEFPANQDQIVIWHENVIDMKPTVHFSQLEAFDTIVVNGGPLMVCGTFSYADGTLEEGWEVEGTEEDDYVQPGLADADENDNARTADRLRNVFQKHRVPALWTGLLNNGEGTSVNNYNALPEVTRDAYVDVTQVATFWQRGKLFEQDLPVLETNSLTVTELDRVRSFAIVQDPEESSRWHFVNKPSDEDLPKATFRLSDREMAFYVEPERANHIYALNAWGDADDSNIDPVFDYTKIMATLFFETDKRLQVITDVPGVVLSETGREKLIDVPDAEYWIMVPNTVYDIQGGNLVRAAEPTYQTFRDDSERLRQIAAMARAWYGSARALLSMELDYLTPEYWSASMVLGILGAWEAQPIGTVITERRYDFTTNKTYVSTGFVEFSLSRMSVMRSAK